MNTMSEQIADLAKALASAQQDLNPASKNSKNPMLHNKYADLASCIAAAREVLPKHGLSYTQIIEAAGAEQCVSVRTVLMHESGQWISSVCTLSMLDSKGEMPKGVNRAQATGSIITYARRYGLSALIGLATDDDDDGCAGATPQNQQQFRQQRQQPQQKPVALLDQFKSALHKAGAKDAKSAFEMASGFLGREIKDFSEITEDEMKHYLSDASTPDNPY